MARRQPLALVIEVRVLALQLNLGDDKYMRTKDKLRTFIIIVLTGLVIGGFINNVEGNRTSCEENNGSLTQLNIRGEVLHDFLNSAAGVRERQALDQQKQFPTNARLNTAAAQTWYKWAQTITPVEIPNCSDLHSFNPLT